MIENHLRLTCSPETIASKFHLAKASIYNWLNQGKLAFALLELPDRNRGRQHSQEKRGQYQTGTSIEQRPAPVNQRTEFAQYHSLEQRYDLTTYFCHPYSPWERGSNEYFNRKLRWFFPKKLTLNK